MLSRIFSLFILYFVLILLSTIPSCEDWLVHETEICGIEFSAMENGRFGTDLDSIPTLDREIMFFVWADNSRTICQSPKLELLPSAYATSICYRFTNSLMQSSFALSFDRPFVHQNDTIPAGTDLFLQPEIAREISSILDESCDWYYSEITFSAALRNACLFEAGEYEVNFKCETSDGRKFDESTSVIFTP